MDFAISFVILIAMMIYFQYVPGKNIVYLAIPIVLLVITAAGLSFWMSSLAVQYRDFRFALGFMLPLLMYFAPVAFPAAMVQDKIGETAYHIYGIYPMVGAIEGFRTCFAGDKPMPWDLITTSYISALIIFITGNRYFRKMEKYFADIA
jgi:lipopolysaccharide transport system permease protein